jgi:hypothetical protein
MEESETSCERRGGRRATRRSAGDGRVGNELQATRWSAGDETVGGRWKSRKRAASDEVVGGRRGGRRAMEESETSCERRGGRRATRRSAGDEMVGRPRSLASRHVSEKTLHHQRPNQESPHDDDHWWGMHIRIKKYTSILS